MTKVAILGGSGYTAAELIKILLRHPEARMEAMAMIRPVQWDAPLWAGLLISLFSLGSLGCFGIAAAQTAATDQAVILDTDNCPAPTDL